MFSHPKHGRTVSKTLLLGFVVHTAVIAPISLSSKQVDGYVLTVAKGGIKFKETSNAESAPLFVFGPATREFVDVEEGAVPSMLNGNFTMSTFVDAFLRSVLRTPVADQTNLPLVYDLTLKIDEIYVRSAKGRGGPGQAPPREFRPPLPKALEEQLGLHLERSKAPVEVLVIDHLEKAKEN